MNVKLLILSITIIAIVIGVYFLIPKDIICKSYVIDEVHKITEKANEPQGIWNNMTTPRGSKLEIIELIESKGLDGAWRRAMYSKEENRFWVADMPGFEMDWYGPFTGKPCLW